MEKGVRLVVGPIHETTLDVKLVLNIGRCTRMVIYSFPLSAVELVDVRIFVILSSAFYLGP